MSKNPPFMLIYAPEVVGHLAFIEVKHHSLLQRTISEQLAHEPANETRNRKPLSALPGPFDATWELRAGPENRFRIFYDVVLDERIVQILAIGLKKGNRLFIGGQEYP